MMAEWHQQGLYGLKQSFSKAVQFYEMAAAQGYADAQYSLGICYANGHGVPQDFEQAATWYRKAAAQGHSDAIHNLTELEQAGLIKPPDAAATLEAAIAKLTLQQQQPGKAHSSSNTSSPSFGTCSNCGKSDRDDKTQLRWCTKCNSVRYCSQECQRADWTKEKGGHKQMCKALCGSKNPKPLKKKKHGGGKKKKKHKGRGKKGKK